MKHERIIENEEMTFEELLERLKPFAHGIIVTDVLIRNCTFLDCPDNPINISANPKKSWFVRKLFNLFGPSLGLATIGNPPRFVLFRTTISGCNFRAKN